MALGITFFIIAFLVIAIWLIIEFKRLKHKLLAFFLIGLIIFTYISFTISLKGHDIDFTSVSGIMDAGKLYFSWLGGVFVNFRSITTYAFKQEWNKADTNITITDKDKESIWEKLK